MSPRRNRGVTTTEQGRSKLREARGQKKMTFEAIAEKADIGLSTVQRFFQGKSVDEETAIKIIKSVGLEPLEIELIKGKNTDEDTMPDEPYVERPPLERECRQLVERPACLLRIKAPEGFGKTSLLLHILEEFKNSEHYREKYRTVYIPVEKPNKSENFTDLNSFLHSFCKQVSEELELPIELEKIHKIMGIFECKNYFEDEILTKINSSLIVGLDSIDEIFSCPMATEFLGMLRSWHERAKIYPVWKKLRLILAYSTNSYIPIDAKSSPFNVGTPIDLREFTEEEVSELVKLNDIEWTQEEVRTLMDMVGGLPNLVALAIHHHKSKNKSINELLSEAELPSGIYYSHLTQLREKIEPNLELVGAMKNVINDPGIQGGSFTEQELNFQLYSMGLVKFENKIIVPRCKLYQRYFSNWNINHD